MNLVEKDGFIIRHFEPSDQVDVRRLYRESLVRNPELYTATIYDKLFPDDVAQNFSHERDAFYVAIADNQIAGFCGIKTLDQDRDTATNVNGLVVPEFRGRKIYPDLFRVREEQARLVGIKTILARVSEKNEKMLQYLLRSGYEVYYPADKKSGFLNFKKILS